MVQIIDRYEEINNATWDDVMDFVGLCGGFCVLDPDNPRVYEVVLQGGKFVPVEQGVYRCRLVDGTFRGDTVSYSEFKADIEKCGVDITDDVERAREVVPIFGMKKGLLKWQLCFPAVES